MDMDNNQAMREFLREKVNKDIVLKYLFIKEMEKDFDDEYIDRMYRIDTTRIRKMYEDIEGKDRDKIEKDILSQIKTGEIDLNREAVNWHREGLKRAHIKETNKINSNSNKGKREER